MKVTLLAVVTLTAVASFVGAADPECVYRKLRGLSPHWPNPTNCSSYYRCSKNTVRSINCPLGKEYNPRNGKCATVGRGLCKLSLAAPLAEATNVCADEVSGAYVPDPGYCGVYYICNEKLAYPQSCDLGSFFDITSNNCQPDTDSVCWQNKCVGEQNGAYLQSSDSCANYYVCTGEQAIEQTCPSGSYFNTAILACVVDEDNTHCWENFCIGQPDGIAVADADNCAVFYMCSNQKATMQQCLLGQYFNVNEQKCIDGPCPDKETTTTCAPITTTPATGCDCEDGTLNGHLTADKDNCRLYYACVDGNLISGDCSTGNYFDKNTLCCERDTTNCCPESSAPDCVNGETKPNDAICNQYYSCVDNTWEDRTCPIDTFFKEKNCIPDVLNECPQCKVDILTEFEIEPIVEIVECNATEAARSTDNCWSYLACMSGQWSKESCAAGYYFDGSVGICRRDDLNLCPENRVMWNGLRSRRSVDVVPETDCSLCINKPNGYQLVNPEDCTSYYTCSNGLAIASTCPTNEYFNDNACVIDVTGVCINPCSCGTGNAAHPICSKYYQCTDGVPQVVDCPTGQGFDSTTLNCNAKVNCSATQCATADNGVTFPVAGDATKFYVCIDKMATIRSCPANTAFDATLKLCLAQPSSECNQSKCKSTTVNTSYPSLNNDNTTFCFCQTDGAYLKNCIDGYSFDEELNICTFTGPCDPQFCVESDEYAPSVNYDDPDSFCLCRAGQQVPVPCPIGYTFKANLLLCVIAPVPDPRCCASYCVGQKDDVTFPAIDIKTGFCVCLDEVPAFNNCPVNKTYDASLGICMTPEEDITCSCNECDSSLCLTTYDEYQAYPAMNTFDGFCYCKEYCGVYTACPADKEFDPKLSLCLVPPGPVVCNATVCDTYPDYKVYEALNGTAGFCYCKDGMPIYRLCPDGKTFDITEGICTDIVDECNNGYCESEKCSCLPNLGTFPSSNTADPSSFCYCQDGEAIYMTCPTGKVYNEKDSVCERQEVPCSVCEAGKCASLADSTTFAALNTTQGFCMCVEGAATFDSCPAGKEYDTTLSLCLNSLAAISEHVTCDSTECNIRGLLKTFAVKDRPRGFCTCQADGTATYQSCEDDHLYDESLSACIVDACDPLQCRTRSKFETFAAKNTTQGFCSCEIVPTYYHCTRGHYFDISLGLCLDELTAIAAACDPRDCKDRVQFQAFAAKNTTVGFCSCDGKDEIVSYHACLSEQVFDRELGMCLISDHAIQKRSVGPEEKFACEVNEKRSVPSNCSQYEICLEGSWRRRTCSEERYYNPEQRRCLEPRDDMVCSYARVLGLPSCNNHTESNTIPSRNGQENCQQYFRCNAGKWRLRSCPKRQYYVPHLSTCLPIPALEGNDFCGWINYTKSIIVECQHLSVRPYSKSCDKFLMCMENDWWIQQCPLGMYFSREHNYCQPNDAQQCRLDVNATVNTACANGQMRALASSCRSYEQCTNNQWLRKSCGKLELFEPLVGCVTNDGSCQGSGLRRSCNSGELRALPLPDSNCSQLFYYCDADEWHLISCLRGHSFMRELNTCQPLEQCQALLQTQPLSSCKGQPDGQSVPHADNCTLFYLCLQQQPALLQSCAAGSFFDAMLGYCRPNDGSCQLNQSVCANNLLGGLVAHNQNCRAFYNCSSSSQNVTQLLYCPIGQYFDSLLSQCRLDQGQCIQQQPLSDSEASLSLCTGLTHGTLLPHKLYCNLYYACIRGLAILAECDQQMRFNVTLGKCEPESELEAAQCQHSQLEENRNSSAAYSCENLQDGSYVPDYSDCTRYYICAEGVTLRQRCGLGAYFDSEQLICLQDNGTCPYVINNATETLNQHMPPNPVLCEGKHGYILPNKANCNNFYICVSNKLRGERCYAGYFFNATLQQCQALKPAKDAQEIETKTESSAVELELVEAQPQLPEICRDAPTDLGQLCQVNGETTSFAEPGDCRRYISCDQDEPISQRCRNGESYDSLLAICRQNDGTCLMENGERVGECNGKHGQLARDIHNCRGYFLCVHGQKIKTECEQGYYFSKATNTCQLDILQQCSNNSNESTKPKSD